MIVKMGIMKHPKIVKVNSLLSLLLIYFNFIIITTIMMMIIIIMIFNLLYHFIIIKNVILDALNVLLWTLVRNV